MYIIRISTDWMKIFSRFLENYSQTSFGNILIETSYALHAVFSIKFNAQCYLKLAVRTDMYTNWFGTVTDCMKSCLMHSGGFI